MAVQEEKRVSSSSRWKSSLHSFVCTAPACTYLPLQFFVAWHGVITVAYVGIPPSMVQLKKQIEDTFPGVVKENPGSKWPKTSLGCLHDGRTLSRADLEVLHQICSEESLQLAGSWPAVVVEKLSVVLYHNCCLEEVVMVTDLPLSLPPDPAGPSQENKDSVAQVLKEFSASNLEHYHHFVAKEGNGSSHYRAAKAGVTLVHFLSSCPGVVKRLRERVDKALPGFYDWFAQESLHITLRAIV